MTDKQVRMQMGFVTQADNNYVRGVLLQIEDAAGKRIGELRFSRAALGDLLSSREVQFARWTQYPLEGSDEQGS